MTLGEQIRISREKNNLSQEELATKLGVSRQAVSKWENGISKPHGMNRDILIQILELEDFEPETQPNKSVDNSKMGFLIAGIKKVLAEYVYKDFFLINYNTFLFQIII